MVTNNTDDDDDDADTTEVDYPVHITIDEEKLLKLNREEIKNELRIRGQ